MNLDKRLLVTSFSSSTTFSRRSFSFLASSPSDCAYADDRRLLSRGGILNLARQRQESEIGETVTLMRQRTVIATVEDLMSEPGCSNSSKCARLRTGRLV